jgi:nucleoside 2-deoxyribosyltransferase
MRVYLAGPLGFSEAGMAFHKEKIVNVLTSMGWEILDPWQLAPASKIAHILQMPYGEPRRAAWEALNPEIGETNALAINSCDLVFAVLDGTDVDSGTSSEIGFAFALGKKILGYRGDIRLSADNEGSTVNLQVEYFIRESGGEIFKHIAELPEALRRLCSGPERSPLASSNPASDLTAPPLPPKPTSEQTSGAKLIIGILLALIVRASLEALFKDPIQEHEAWPTLLVWFQLVIFSILMARFYLGATRYIDTQPKSLALWVSTANVVFASLLFGAFYVAALAVGDNDLYIILVTMHAIDAVWFLFGFLTLWILCPVDRAGEIKIASNKGIMIIFFSLSVATIVSAALLFAMVHFAIIEAVTAKYSFLCVLFAVSIYDFVSLRDYYFAHSNWIQQNTA